MDCMRSIQSTLEIRWYPGRNLAIIVEAAAVNHRQKKMGYNAAEALYKRVQANLAKKRENPDDEE